MKLEADLLEAKHWIYPLNRPKRDYQFNIVKNCLFENTLVALPTGLGKTFIAGVVMLNCNYPGTDIKSPAYLSSRRLSMVSTRKSHFRGSLKTTRLAADQCVS
jgi:hypothetical protein